MLDGEDAQPPSRRAQPRRAALDAALREMDAGRSEPSARVAARVLADAGPGAAARRGGAAPRRRHDALGSPGRRAVRHADRARVRAPDRPQRQGDGAASRSSTPARSSSRATSCPTRSRSTGTRPRRPRRRPRRTPSAEDPGAARRFWFEHATGAGKTVAALGFVEASRTGGILILTHRRNLVDQFLGELRDRGYRKRISARAAEERRRRAARGRPGHGRDLPVVRAQRRQGLGRVHDRDLRRGAHRARREDERARSASGSVLCSWA